MTETRAEKRLRAAELIVDGMFGLIRNEHAGISAGELQAGIVAVLELLEPAQTDAPIETA